MTLCTVPEASLFQAVVCLEALVVYFIQCVPLATEPDIEDIATKFEQEYVRCVRNEEECVCSVCLQCA